MGPWSNASTPMPRFHDCGYIRQRNALIVEAERIANLFVDLVPPGEDVNESRAKWTRAFSIAMDELAEPLLNGSSPAGR
jgi:hypothetical protein